MKATITILRLICIISALPLSGCATTDHMTEVLQPTELKPAPEKTLVVFMRPSSYGGGILATVYDGIDYVGTVPANTKFAYECDPGEHMFMVIGESADFMKANLAPDKTYYARVAARMGVWKARFSFIPYNGNESEEDLQEWLEDTTLMKTNETGRQWAIEHTDSIREKHDDYLPEWQEKDASSQMKQTLLRSSGR